MPALRWREFPLRKTTLGRGDEKSSRISGEFRADYLLVSVVEIWLIPKFFGAPWRELS